MGHYETTSEKCHVKLIDQELKVYIFMFTVTIYNLICIDSEACR